MSRAVASEARPDADGGSGPLGGLIDVSEVAVLRAALRESERRFSLIHDAVPFGIAMTKMPEGTLVSVNQAFLTLFELDREEAIGKTSAQLGIAPAESVARVVAELRERGSVRDLEVERKTKSGSRLVLSLNVDRVSSESGDFVLTTIQDVTAARAASEEAVRLRDEFLSVAAHELKTPVTSLRAFTELLLRDVARRGTPDPVLFARALGRLDEQTRRLSRLITQLLDVSRIRLGRLALELGDVDLGALVRNVAGELGGSDPRVHVDVDEPLIVRGDAIRLDQVVRNLLDNALKYSSAQVAVSVTRDDACAVMSVADAGPGIPSDDRDRVFDPFYRAKASDHHPGMGLGLFITKQIVEQHCGLIAVDYPVSGGMRVTVRLPIQTPI